MAAIVYIVCTLVHPFWNFSILFSFTDKIKKKELSKTLLKFSCKQDKDSDFPISDIERAQEETNNNNKQGKSSIKAFKWTRKSIGY